MTLKEEAKQFELLVARIEEAAAPRGAVVTSPDRIRDSVTGQMREVDASIRFQVGTIPVLLLVECRKRDRSQDVRWIEELATKRNSVRADKVVAVSATGFSAPAQRAAKHHGIELRTLREVSPAQIASWFLPPGGVTNVFRVIEDVECIVGFLGPDGSPENHGFAVPSSTAPVFHSDLIHSPFPAEVLVQILEKSEPEGFWGVPLDGTKTRLVFNLDCATGSWLHADTSHGRRAVAWVSFSIVVSYVARSFSLAEGAHHQYEGEDMGAVQVSSFNSEIFGGRGRFEFQSGKSSGILGRFEFTPEEGKGLTPRSTGRKPRKRGSAG